MKLPTFVFILAFSTVQASAQALYSGRLLAAKDKHLIAPIQLRVQNGIAEIYFGSHQEAKVTGTFSAKDSHSFHAEFKIPRGEQIETVHLNGQVLGQKIKARIEVEGYPGSAASADLELRSNGATTQPQAPVTRHPPVIDDYDGRMAAERFLALLVPRH